MKDDPKGLVNHPPIKKDHRLVFLSPILDSYKGDQFDHNPPFAGETPLNNVGLIPEAEREVPDKPFREFPESGKRVGKKGFGNG